MTFAINIPGPVDEGLGWFIGKALDPVKDAALAPLKALAGGIADAVAAMLTTLGTLWVKLDTPNVWSESGGTGATVAWLHSETAPLVGLLAVVGIFVGACRLAWEQRGEAGRDIGHGLLVLVLVTGCGVPAIGLLVSGSDAFAQSVIEQSTTGTDFGRNITTMLALNGPVMAPVLVIFFGVIALIVSVIQIVLLVFRAGMLVLLAGLLPVAASMTTTQTGREHFKKYSAWVVALAIYKPAAALIYGAAFRLIGSHDLNASGAASVLIGLSLMTAAVVALPALLRFLVPAAGALHRGGGGMAHAMTAASMAMPTGARMLAGHGAASSAAGAAGSSGPSGAAAATGASGAAGAGGAAGGAGAAGTAGSAGAAGAAAGPVAAATATGASVAKGAVDGATTNPERTDPDGSR